MPCRKNFALVKSGKVVFGTAGIGDEWGQRLQDWPTLATVGLWKFARHAKKCAFPGVFLSRRAPGFIAARTKPSALRSVQQVRDAPFQEPWPKGPFQIELDPPIYDGSRGQRSRRG